MTAAVLAAFEELRDRLSAAPGLGLKARPITFLRDQFKLPSGKKVSLSQLVGFKLQLAPPSPAPLPEEEAIIERATRRAREVPEAGADTAGGVKR
jgi:hypothetical protein